MNLIPGICSQCGATLSVNTDEHTMLCPYCNTPFLTKDAIQEFNITYQITNNITAKNVIVQENTQKDFDIVGGVLRKYSGKSVNVVIPSGVLHIAENAFSDMMINSVKMSNDIISIGKKAFANCTLLKKISFSENLVKIDDYSFSYCEELTQITLPNKLESIGEWAFCGCKSLQEISFPQSLIELKMWAFKDCVQLSQITLPDYLEVVSSAVFDGCKNLKSARLSMYLLKSNENIGLIFAHETFSEDFPYSIGCPKLTSIYIDGEILEKNDELYDYFPYTKFGERKIRRDECRCQYCGGDFTGIPFLKYCEKCGRRKDY